MRFASTKVGVAAIACALMAMPSASAAQAPIGLEIDPGQPSPTLNFGDERKESTLAVRFLAAESLDRPPTVSLLPFQTTEGDTLSATVKPEVKLRQQGRTVLVKLPFTELGDAQSGTFASPLLLRGKGVADARATITAKLEPKPVAGAGFWAIVLLLAGAVLGLIVRWVITVGAKLDAQSDRLAVVEAKIEGLEPLPAVFRGKLTALRIQLAQGNAEGAEATLKELEEQTAAAIQVAEVAASIRASIADHEAQIKAMANLGAAAGKLAQVLINERELADKTVNAADFETPASAEARAGYLDDVRRVRVFLSRYAEETSRPALAAALEHFVNGEFKEGAEAAKASVTSGRLADAIEEEPTKLTVPPTPAAPGRSLRNWATDNAGTIAAAFTAIALVIVGLFTAYQPDSTFRTDAFMDAVTLFAWGLGSAAAGIGLTELTSKLTAGKAAPA